MDIDRTIEVSHTNYETFSNCVNGRTVTDIPHVCLPVKVVVLVTK